jgi:hypothetical protein
VRCFVPAKPGNFVCAQVEGYASSSALVLTEVCQHEIWSVSFEIS